MEAITPHMCGTSSSSSTTTTAAVDIRKITARFGAEKCSFLSLSSSSVKAMGVIPGAIWSIHPVFGKVILALPLFPLSNIRHHWRCRRRRRSSTIRSRRFCPRKECKAQNAKNVFECGITTRLYSYETEFSRGGPILCSKTVFRKAFVQGVATGFFSP